MKPTQEQVIAWAREAGGDDWGLLRDFMPEIERFAALVAAAECEVVANIVEQMGIEGYGTLAIAVAIRARREQ